MLFAVLLAFAAVASAQSPGGIFNFIALGDWGGQGTAPYTEPGEVAAASGMDIVARRINSSFVLAMGDNFYDEGIPTNEYDPRFNSTFEDVYTYESLQTPWIVLAGNHDHYGNVSAEIAYSSLSPRWHFPNYYYKQSYSFPTSSGVKTLDIILIDTVLLAGNTDYVTDVEAHNAAPPGPEDEVAAQTQWQWIEATLAASTADYLWVTGQYPVWSVCSHGPTAILVSQLKPMLEKYKATGYASGHDHCLEYLDDGTGIQYILAGAGDNCCYTNSNAAKVPTGSLKFLISETASNSTSPILGGFASFRFFDDYMNVVYHDELGNDLFTTPNFTPRSN